jgi:hypothetical protein
MRETLNSNERSLSRTLGRVLMAGGLILACVSASPSFSQPSSGKEQYDTTVAYLEQFYPLWFTYNQSHGTPNRMVGPDRISPLYQTVVAINVDTLYASAFLDLTAQPVVLTVPSTQVTYSVLVLDSYGNIVDTPVSTTAPGVYEFVGPGYTGAPVAGVTPVTPKLNHMIVIFRADKYSSTNQEQIRQAEQFRKSLLMQTLSNWQTNPTGGAATILPELHYAAPFKTAADAMIAKQPVKFLQELQKAVAAPNTPPLSTDQQALSDAFNRLFAQGGDMSQFAAGAQAAHTAILQNYLTHTDKNNWIDFANIGTWAADRSGALDRSSITEYIQYGNNFQAAAYYQAFNDVTGASLNGSAPGGYVLKFAKPDIPQAKRFWSLTAYTPQSIELIRNDARQYHIASYSPGLKYNPDGSVSIYMAKKRPMGVPVANWLPVAAGPFNVMLRVYGPEGIVAKGDYVPPGIVKR